MHINIRQFLQCVFTLLFAGVIASCNGTNVDSVTEVSCSTADGLWTITGATCNGVAAADVLPVTYLFDSEAGTITQSSGRVDCSTQFNWLVEIGSQTAIFSMNGTGNLTCFESGISVDSCSSDVNACNAGVDITGIKNEYPTCVITNGSMSLRRTVSAVNNPDNLSYCENGEDEVVQLVRGDYTPPEPAPEPDSSTAFIVIEGPNPLDFGTHPVGDRITQVITLTNTGRGVATGLTVDGLATPFSFLGVNYPGAGGTCENSLNVGESCTLVVEFFPLLADYFTDTLIVTFGNGLQTVTLNHGLAATSSGDLAQLTISDGPFYNFGSTEIGTPVLKIFTVTNTGNADAMAVFGSGLEAPFQFSGGGFPGLNGDCGAVLATNSTCTVEVELAPTSEDSFNDIIEINYLDGVNNQQVRRNVFGQGVLPPSP